MSDPLRVLLVDDRALFRKGLVALFRLREDFCVVGEAGDGLEAMSKARSSRPDVILMDVCMPNCDGLTATRCIKQELPQVKIIMLTVSDHDEDLFTAIKNGADGYLLKNLEPEQLFAMLDGVRHGEAAIQGALAVRILEEFRLLQGKLEHSQVVPDPDQQLTPRELDVLRLVAAGATNKQVAAALAITENTVKLHLRNILEKLHLQNRVQAAAYAIRQGLTGEAQG